MNRLFTTAGETRGNEIWSCYPRPQLRREVWLNLNGPWDFTAGDISGTIQVPFCPESALSGLEKPIPPGTEMVYTKRFTLPWTGRTLLHIGAADQIAEIYVNQKPLGRHEGGYWSFTLDITPALVPGENELVIRIRDDLRDQSFPYGKQTLRRGGMWYTPVSGLWQTVWLEPVPEEAISALDIQVDCTRAVITVAGAQTGTVHCEGRTYPLVDGRAEIVPEKPQLWSPENPYLYEFSVETPTDRVESYFALRTIEVKDRRLCLNGKPYFFHGLLDQGYWPDGLFTPATPEGFREDILAMKNLGFNMLRKHIKVEPEEFYCQCDKLGMVVFQDMVNNGPYSFLRDTALPTAGFQTLNDKSFHRDPLTRQRFFEGMEATVAQLKNHPSILYWTVFNEGWGQFDADAACRRLRTLDSSRIIDAASGWFRRQETDVDSRHVYFKKVKPVHSHKPFVLSEFGGYSCKLPDHAFNPDHTYGYGKFSTPAAFMDALEKLYREQIIPLVATGLCAAVYTQVSDVEDETNGLLTYDRKVCKVDPQRMQKLAEALKC